MSSYYNEAINKEILWGGIPRLLAIPPILLIVSYIAYFLVSVNVGSVVYIVPILISSGIYYFVIRSLVSEDPNNLKFWFLAYKIKQMNKGTMLNTITTKKSTPFLFPHENYGIITEYGSLIITYELGFVDSTYLSGAEKALYEEEISNSIENVFSSCELHFNEFRSKAKMDIPKSKFSSQLLQEIEDDIHDKNINNLQLSNFFLSIIIPNLEDYSEEIIDKKLEDIDRKIKSLFKTYKRLEINEHLSFLHRVITQDKVDYEWISYYIYIFELLNIDIDFSNNLLINGAYKTKVISITGLPKNLASGLFNYLSDLDHIEYRVSSRFRPLSKEEIESTLKRKIKIMETSSKGVMGNVRGKHLNEEDINYEYVHSQEQIRQARRDLGQSRKVYGHFSMSIILTSKTLDDEALIDIANNLIELLPSFSDSRVTGKIESINSINAYLGSIPGNSSDNKRELLINVPNLVDLINFYSFNIGEIKNKNPKFGDDNQCLTVLRTVGYTPYFFNLDIGDVGHSVMVGQTGSGKSTFLSLIISQFLRYKDSKVVVLQKDRGMTPFIKGIGGIEIDPIKSGHKFAPLSSIDPSDRDEVSKLVNFILNMACFNNDQIKKNPDNVKFVHDALMTTLNVSKEQVALDFYSENDADTHDEFIGDEFNGDDFNSDEITDNNEISNISFSTLISAIQSNEIREALDMYKGSIFDGINDDFVASINQFNICAIEVANLLKSEENVSVPILEYLFKKIGDMITGKPFLIVIDEAQFLGLSSQITKEIKDYLETIRKNNGRVLFATLSPSKFYDVSESFFNTVNESCLTKIFLRGAESKLDKSKQFDLTEDQQNTINNMQVKKQALIVKQDMGHKVVDIYIPDVLLKFGTASKDQLLEIDQLDKDIDFFEYWRYRNDTNN